jgi:HK97 family phage major capsid protein
LADEGDSRGSPFLFGPEKRNLEGENKMSKEKEKVEGKLDTGRLDELQSEIVGLLKEHQAKVDAQLKEIEQKNKPDEKLAEEIAESKAAIERHATMLNELRATIDRTGAPVGGGLKSVGQEVIDNEHFQNYAKRGWHKGEVVINVKDGFFQPERKTTITSAAVGSATSGILVPQRVQDLVPLARRRFTLRDLLPSRPVEANAIEFPYVSAVTSAASPQTEASAKGESAITYDIGTATVRTLAHWIPATRQVLDDWPSLGRTIEDELLYQLKLKEEEEILSGDGTGVHLNGLVTQATSYAGTYNVAADTNLDRLRWAILEAEDDDEEVDFIVLNPVNFWTIMGIKDQATNVGNYVVGNPTNVPQPMTLWNKIVIVTNTLTSGTFLVGSSRQAEVFDRQQANVVISTEHSTYFTSNMVAIRAEERIALAVYRATAFITGSFS